MGESSKFECIEFKTNLKIFGKDMTDICMNKCLL